jgi:molybdate transport system permease protein
LTASAVTRPEGGDAGNKLFAALLVSFLIFFLAASTLLLLSNVWYLAGAREAIGKSGWRLFVESLGSAQNHFAIKLSIVSAGVTAVLCMVIAIPAAYSLSRFRFPFSGVVDTLLDLPIVLPPPVIGISLLIFFRTPAGVLVNHLTPQWLVSGINGFLSLILRERVFEYGRWVVQGEIWDDGTTWALTTRGIIIAQFFAACAFGVRAVKAAFDTIGARHEEVARTLGCTRRQAFFKVVLPMARNGIVAGAVLTWARAIAEFGPILFFCSAIQWKTEVMPIRMFLLNSSGRIEEAAALVIIMILISALTLLTFKRLGGRGYMW